MGKKLDQQMLGLFQLASLLAAQGGQFAAFNPGQSQFAAGLQDSAQGSIAAQANKIARKREENTSGIDKAFGALKGGATGAILGSIVQFPFGTLAGAGLGAASGFKGGGGGGGGMGGGMGLANSNLGTTMSGLSSLASAVKSSGSTIAGGATPPSNAVSNLTPSRGDSRLGQIAAPFNQPGFRPPMPTGSPPLVPSQKRMRRVGNIIYVEG